MKAYLQRHLAMGKYLEKRTDGFSYHHRHGWQDFYVGEGIVFSHRTNEYAEENFPEHLHSHDYCELLFWVSGEVQYLCGDRGVFPKEGCVVMIPPEKSHTARLVSPSTYERFVLYFKSSAFDFCGQSTGIFDGLFSESDAVSFCLSPTVREEVRARLSRIEKILKSESTDAQLLSYAEITLLLHSLKKEKADAEIGGEALPVQVRNLRNFLDEHYASVSSVEEIATRFYYSREYVTRIFAQYFNLSPWKYVEQLRIRDACHRIDAGEKITAVCYAVGYHSMSAFSAAFRRVMGASPTEYKQK